MGEPVVTRLGIGSHYAWAKAGDVLSEHYHPPGSEHDLFVERGRVRVNSPPGPGEWVRVYGQGRHVDLPHGRHTITALEDNTVTIHRPLNQQVAAGGDTASP